MDEFHQKKYEKKNRFIYNVMDMEIIFEKLKK